MKKAFTLIEIIVTVAILSLLFVLSTFYVNDALSNTRMSKTKSELKIVRDAVQTYINLTGYVPVNSGLGMTKENFEKSIQYDYVVLNMDSLSHKQLLEDGKILEAQMPSIPDSSKFKKANVVNTTKKNPNFIYVIDRNCNVYLANGSKDSDYNYYIDTKIYDIQDANVIDKKYNLKYKGNLPIVEELEKSTTIDLTDATIVYSDIVMPNDLLTTPNAGNPNVGDTGYKPDTPLENKNSIFYKNLSSIGYTVFAEIYNINFSVLDHIDAEIKVGNIKKSIELQAVSSSRWIARINSSDLQKASGNYVTTIVVHDINNKSYEIGSFTVLVDNIAPTVEIVKSKDNFYSEKPITITLNGIDALPSSLIKKIEYRIDNGPWTEYKKPFDLSTPDYYLIEARAVDNYNNMSKISSSIVNNYLLPEVYISQASSKAIIDIGVDVADEDVLWQSSFESGQTIPNLNCLSTPKYGLLGGQSITTEDSFTGTKSYMLNKNNDGNGNIYFYPSTNSNTSRATFGNISRTVINNMHLSLVYRYRSISNSNISVGLDGGWAYSIRSLGKLIAEDINTGSYIIKLNSVSGLSLGQHITTDTNPTNVVWMNIIREIDYANNTIKVSSPTNRKLYKGETLQTRDWRGAGNFQNNNVADTSGEWKLFTSNTLTSNYSDFNIYTRGTGAFLFQSSVNGKLYIDDVKMGYASRIILYKNGARFNTEAQEYTTHYEDNNVSDINKPVIKNIQVNKDLTDFNITLDADDVGTTYIYGVTRISKEGKEYYSKPKSLTTTSGIDKYYYVIDNAPDTKDIPKTTYSVEGIINKNLDTSKSWYIHIIAVDKAGNISEITHSQVN